MASVQRPTTIHTLEALAPRGPWSFLRSSIAGGFTRWGLGLLGGWLLVALGPGLAWAGHLRRAAGWSALPAHWGERITARDIWELLENGGLKHRLTNSPTVHLLGLGLVIVLWCGWRMQTETVGHKARLGPWLLGALDTVLIGFLPVGLFAWAADSAMAWLGGIGINGLGWLALIGRPLLLMAAVAALNLQWWFCRLSWAEGFSRGYLVHLRDCFLRLWSHPIQWFLLNLGGAMLRAGLPFLVLLLAWYLGGGTSFRVWLFLVLSLLVTLVNGWVLGWMLRAVALFSSHDAAVRDARASLKESLHEA